MSSRKFKLPISERVPLADLRSVPHFRPETSGPPPLHPFLYEDQQDRVWAEHRNRLIKDRLPGLPDVVAGTVESVAENRFASRMMAGYDNLEGATRLNAELTPEQRKIANLALKGTVNPAEGVYISDVLGIRGEVLGVVSHFYGAHMSHLTRLRGAHAQTVELFSGQSVDQTPTFKVKNVFFDSESGQPDAVLMTRKRNLARLADHVIDKERSSFVLRLDEASGLSASAVDEFLEYLTDEEAVNQELTVGSRLHTVTSSLLRHDRHDIAVPISTTIYKFDESIPLNPSVVAASRKISPHLSMLMTRKRLVAAGVPVNDPKTAMVMPLISLVDPKRRAA